MAWFKNGRFRVTQTWPYLPQDFGINRSVRWSGGRPVDLRRVSFAAAAADQNQASSANVMHRCSLSPYVEQIDLIKIRNQLSDNLRQD